ncbi:hypothetical protein ACFLUC_02855 [Chloroflexota bacterium]
MTRILNWLSDHKYQIHLLAFLLMVLPAIPLYYAAQQGAYPLIWGLLAIVVSGNILALLTK